MNWILRFIGVDELLEALLRRFNLPYLVRALRAFLEALNDQRVDNEELHVVVLAAVARAETFVPSGGGYSKYKAVVAATLAASKAWVVQYAGDVLEAFESRIDDEIQLAHREMEKILRDHGNAKLASISATIDDYPHAAAALEILKQP